MRKFVCVKKMMPVAGICLLSATFALQAQEQPLTLDLNRALEIAMSENPTVKVADQEIEKKKYARKGAYAALFPQISLSGDYSRTLKKQVMYMDMDGGFGLESMMEPTFRGIEQTFASQVPGYTPGTLMKEIIAASPPPDPSAGAEGISIGRDNNWSTGFTAGMPLVNAALWKSLSISAIDVELSVEQARASKIDMANQVKKSYYGVLLANDSYRVFKESYDNAVANYRDIKNKFDQGMVAEYDLIRAGVSVKNLEPNLLQAENAATLSKWQLKALLGVDLELAIECEGRLSDFESELFADYVSTLDDVGLDDNSTLKQLDIQARLLKGTLEMQKLDFLPTLSLSALYQWSSMNNDFRFRDYRWNPYSMVGLSVSMPIFSGGSRLNKVKQTRVSLHQLGLQRDDAERSLQLAVKQFRDNMRTCVKRFDAAQKGVEQAGRGYEIARKRYDTGAGTLLEMNDAELAMMQAKLNFNQAIYDYMTAKSELEKIEGKQYVK
ncbi:MAG: TolC family protein [Tannerellaceae bacterium]|jgi:outer membrane protein TolC|nr:TolC family protein [Tannerellaceae bacterium]